MSEAKNLEKDAIERPLQAVVRQPRTRRNAEATRLSPLTPIEKYRRATLELAYLIGTACHKCKCGATRELESTSVAIMIDLD